MRAMRCFYLLLALLCGVPTEAAVRFAIRIPNQTKPLTGHLILVIAKEVEPEPRFQVSETYDSAQAFGADVQALRPGQTITVNSLTTGYPLMHLSDVKPGEYFVQAVFNVYEEFHPQGSVAVELAPDRGEGQQWNSKPGNFYCKPQKIRIASGEGSSKTLPLVLDQTIPAIDLDFAKLAEQDGSSKWLRWLHIRSALLSQFWNREVYLGAWVLLPDGWSEHPDAHFPLVFYQDHFHPEFAAGAGFSPKPRPPDPKKPASVDYRYKLFQDWTSGRLPRVLLLYVQDANPYYDDSYNVNSANIGPYGDAITSELIPAIEKQFRGIGQAWARTTYGGSTGGWESLATQIFYPDFYNGTWSSCPDPVDFHAYQNVDLYKDTNAYARSGPFGTIPIAEMREANGTIVAEMEPANRREFVFGTHGRSGEQFDAWQAVFSPRGADGYPQAVYDKQTGAIDAQVVRYWHDHYDLTAIVQRDWPRLGPKLEGKLHLAAGEADTWFLNNAVHLLQDALAKTREPHADATFDYGPGKPHCYSGEPNQPLNVSGPTIVQRVLPEMVEHMLKTAPPDADVTSWRY